MEGIHSGLESLTEAELIDRAADAASAGGWVLGECASEWTQRYSQGRTDADFGDLVGASPDEVQKARRVWEVFGGSATSRNLPGLLWSHFVTAAPWGEEARYCLEWASENGQDRGGVWCAASIRELRAFYRMRTGQPLEPEPELEPVEPDRVDAVAAPQTPREDSGDVDVEKAAAAVLGRLSRSVAAWYALEDSAPAGKRAAWRRMIGEQFTTAVESARAGDDFCPVTARALVREVLT